MHHTPREGIIKNSNESERQFKPSWRDRVRANVVTQGAQIFCTRSRQGSSRVYYTSGILFPAARTSEHAVLHTRWMCHRHCFPDCSRALMIFVYLFARASWRPPPGLLRVNLFEMGFRDLNHLALPASLNLESLLGRENRHVEATYIYLFQHVERHLWFFLI